MLVVRENSQNFIFAFLTNFISEETKKAYLNDLQAFFSFCAARGRRFDHPSKVTSLDIIAFRQSISYMSDKTVARKISTLKSLFSWLVEQRIVEVNPAASVKIKKAEAKNPSEALTNSEALQILEAPNTLEYRGSLHSLMFNFLFRLGLRRSELLSIKLEDILSDEAIKITGKGNKVRLLPLSAELQISLKSYIEFYQKESGKILEPSDFLFQPYTNKKIEKPMNTSSVFRLLRRYAKTCGIKKRISPHSCRTTLITKLIDEGTPITEVAQVAGHSSIVTTQLYWRRLKDLKDSPVLKIKY